MVVAQCAPPLPSIAHSATPLPRSLITAIVVNSGALSRLGRPRLLMMLLARQGPWRGPRCCSTAAAASTPRSRARLQLHPLPSLARAAGRSFEGRSDASTAVSSPCALAQAGRHSTAGTDVRAALHATHCFPRALPWQPQPTLQCVQSAVRRRAQWSRI